VVALDNEESAFDEKPRELGVVCQIRSVTDPRLLDEGFAARRGEWLRERRMIGAPSAAGLASPGTRRDWA